MKQLVMLSLLVPATLSACATTTSTRERGLVALRAVLDPSQPVGRVVGGSLVHGPSGLSLLQLPSVGWHRGVAAGKALLFEGAPGAALVLLGSEASVVRMNGDNAEWVTVLSPSLPTQVVSLYEVDLDFELPDAEAPQSADANELEEGPDTTTARLDVPQYKAGVSARFNEAELEIMTADDDLLLSLGKATPDEACGGGFKASLERGVTTDGATWFHYVAELVSRIPQEECTDAMRAAPRKSDVEWTTTRTATFDVWFMFPADGGAPRVVASESTDDEDYVVGRSTLREVRVPGGHITFRGDVIEAYAGEDTWSWTLFTDDGDTFELANGD